MGNISSIFRTRLEIYYEYIRYSGAKWFIKLFFSRKTVAVIGNAASSFDKELGKLIDQHDLVVRLNLLIPLGYEKYLGSKTNIRVLGSTLQERHISQLQRLDKSTLLLTTSKNMQILKPFSIKSVFYNKRLPMKAFIFFDKLLGTDFSKRNINKPPRSGLVFLAMLLNYANPKKVSIFGISTSAEQAVKFISFSDQKVREYDDILLAKNHCDPMLEIEIVNELIKKGYVTAY